jgi:hypothetical protein
MRVNRHIGLLADLLSVMRKYERSEVIEAIQALQNPEWRSEIIMALNALVELKSATTNRTKSQTRGLTKRSSREYFQEFVLELGAKQNSDGGQITRIIEKIATRKGVKNASALREVASSLSIDLNDTKLDRWSVARSELVASGPLGAQSAPELC